MVEQLDFSNILQNYVNHFHPQDSLVIDHPINISHADCYINKFSSLIQIQSSTLTHCRNKKHQYFAVLSTKHTFFFCLGCICIQASHRKGFITS